MIKKNIAWNFLGGVMPLIVGLIIFPLIINSYGTERFGILAIAWSLVGYFSLFDMGLARALTQMVSTKLAKNDSNDEITEMIKTAFRLMWLLGIIGGVVLWFVTPWLIREILKISPSIQNESIQAFAILAVSIPLVVHTSALRGVMDALHLFKQASLIRLVMGLGTFLGPYFASLYDTSLVYAAYALVLVRLISWIMHYYAVNNTHLLKAIGSTYNTRWLKPLFSFGGWMTVSNIVGPLMVYLDRFVIAAMLGTAAVTYYVAPYEVITKLWVIPAAITGVLFPIFAKEWESNPAIAAKILNQGVSYILLIMYPIVLIAAMLSNEWLTIWLGKKFAVEGASLVGWLAAGVLVNSVAQIVYAKIQGAGRADWTAKLHLAESLPYWVILWFALKNFGIEGAAIAWFARVSIDAIGLVYVAGMLSIANRNAIQKPLMLMCVGLIPIISSIYIDELMPRLILCAIAMFLYIFLALQKLYKDKALLNFKFYN